MCKRRVHLVRRDLRVWRKGEPTGEGMSAAGLEYNVNSNMRLRARAAGGGETRTEQRHIKLKSYSVLSRGLQGAPVREACSGT